MDQPLKTSPAPSPAPPSRCPWDSWVPCDDLPTEYD